MSAGIEHAEARGVSLAERTSDGLNPILVKEVRQALRGRYFKISFWVTLTVATLVGLGVLLLVNSGEFGRDEDVFGPPFFVAMFGCLAVATLILVPFSAFLSMGSEWDENTFDLLVLSNLRPRQVVLGKVLSAVVQALLFFSAFGPFLVFAFLLRGIDLTALLVALMLCFAGSVILSCLSVAMSSFGRGRFARLLLMVLLAVVLVWSTVGMIAWGGQSMFFPGKLHDSELRQGLGAAVSIASAVAAFFFAAACARLAHPEENGSSGLRWMTLVAVAVGLGWLTFIMGSSIEEEPTLIAVCLAHAALGLATLFFASEPERLGRRVEATLPRSRLLRLLAFPMLPGGARGLVFYLASAALIPVWMTVYSWLAKGNVVFDEHELRVPLVLTLYGFIYIGIPTGAFSFKSETLLARTLARITTVVLFILSLLLPALVGFLVGFEDWARFEHPFNVFLSVEDIWKGRGDIEGINAFLIVGSLISLALNAPRLLKALRVTWNLPGRR